MLENNPGYLLWIHEKFKWFSLPEWAKKKAEYNENCRKIRNSYVRSWGNSYDNDGDNYYNDDDYFWMDEGWGNK